ncbi:MAG: PAS domain S-box-containing protein [Alphaproteobacteria bacterium]
MVACFFNRIKASPARYQLFQIILVMILIVLGVMSASIWVLYNTALNAERARLSEGAQSQARLIEAITRFNNQDNISKGPEHAFDATLTQVTDAHEKHKGFGETGEFTLAQRQYGNIVFLLRHRHYDFGSPKPIPWESNLSGPMHRALEGASGVMTGIDYRGVQVLAAYEPVAAFGAGIVAKIDMSEIRAPFLKASALTFLGALIILFWGVVLLRRISQPAIAHEKIQKTLRQSEARFRNLVEGSIQGFLIHQDLKILFANQAIADILRYDSPSELMALDSLIKTIPVSERDRIRRNKDARMRGDDAPDTYEIECLAKDGSHAWVEIRLSVVDWNGQTAIQGTYVEITQRKTAEARRRDSQAQLQSILDHFPGVILLKNVQRQYVLANKAYLRQWRLTEDQVIGKTADEIWPRARANEITDRDTQVIESGQIATG